MDGPASAEGILARAQFRVSGERVAAGAFFGDHVDDAVLQRYRVASSKEIPNVRMGGERIITQNGLVDSEYDNHLVIGPNGFGSCSSLNSSEARENALVKPAMKAYSAEHPEGPPQDLAKLLPYATTAEQRTIIERWARNQGKRR
jgi:hypothetical protein